MCAAAGRKPAEGSRERGGERLGADAGLLVAGHGAGAVTVVVAGGRGARLDADFNAGVAGEAIGAHTGRATGEEAGPGDARLVWGAFRITSAFDIGVVDAEAIVAVLSCDALPIVFAGLGAFSVHAEEVTASAIESGDAFRVGAWGADGTKAGFVA